MERNVGAQQSECMELQNNKKLDESAFCNKVMQSINITNTNISSISEKIEAIEVKTDFLEREMKQKIQPTHPMPTNHEPQSTDAGNHQIIDCDLLLLVDSNGKFIQEDKINKNLKCQKLSSMKLENLKNMLNNAKFKKLPIKVFINIGINNLETDTTHEIISKYEDCIEILRSKIPNVLIYISSIFLRKDKKFYNESIEINTCMENYSKIHQNVHFINNCNIENNQMADAKHLNRNGLFTLITNLKYVLFGFLPRINFNPERSNRNTKYGNHRNYDRNNNGYGRY